MATEGTAAGIFLKTRKLDGKDDGADLPPPPKIKIEARQHTEEFAAFQLQQELSRMQMQFQKEVCQ